MKIYLNKHSSKFEGAAIVPVYSDSKKDVNLNFVLDSKNLTYAQAIVERFEAGDRSVRLVTLPEPEKYGKFSIILLGLGEKKKFSNKKFAVAIRRIVSFAKGEKIKSAVISIPDFGFEYSETELVRAAATNLLTADFEFNKYKEEPKGGWPKINDVYLFSRDMRSSKELEEALKTGAILGEEINNCRYLANTPGGDMTPKMLADNAVKAGKRAGFSVKVLGEVEIKKLGMGGVIGVSRGSSEKPRFVIAEYMKGPKNQKPLLLVGKGVTFDSGGLNLKPSAHIYEMHMDMSGGAAVIYALSAIARAKLKINVVALVPAVENMPSGSSYRPGDVLRSITGKTIEIMNTDAEGRVILADALGYAQKYKPELIVDVATLTGSAMAALGQRAMALFTNDDQIGARIQQLGDKVAEPVWPLPVWDEYFEDIKGTFGDVANDGKSRYGGAIQGAIFLKQFIGEYPWVHLDIAPTMTTIDGQYLAKGASGTSVGLLFALAEEMIQGK